MSRKAKFYTFYILGMVLCIVPVMACIFSEFPSWRSAGWEYVGSGICLSGITGFLLSIAYTPLLKVLLKKIKTPAVWAIWGIVALAAYCIRNVIDAVAMIAFVGFLGNALGAVFFMVANIYKDKSEGKEE